MFALDSSITLNTTLYFGESSNFTSSEKDIDKRYISQMLAAHDNNENITPISKGAIHAGTYHALVKRISDNNHIKTIIISLNLRSFGINWIESYLETNLSRANVLYSNYPPIIKKFMLGFKAYDNKDNFKRNEIVRHHYKYDKFKLKTKNFECVRDWDAVVYDKGVLDENGVKDKDKTEVACHFIKNYAFVLSDNNPRVKDLDEIVNYCKEKKIKLLFHLLPENIEKAQVLCGEDLNLLIDQNAEFLQKRYSAQTSFVNNYNILPDSCFIDKQWPTEHYNEYGRRLVANKIYSQLKLLKNAN